MFFISKNQIWSLHQRSKSKRNQKNLPSCRATGCSKWLKILHENAYITHIPGLCRWSHLVDRWRRKLGRLWCFRYWLGHSCGLCSYWRWMLITQARGIGAHATSYDFDSLCFVHYIVFSSNFGAVLAVWETPVTKQIRNNASTNAAYCDDAVAKPYFLLPIGCCENCLVSRTELAETRLGSPVGKEGSKALILTLHGCHHRTGSAMRWKTASLFVMLYVWRRGERGIPKLHWLSPPPWYYIKMGSGMSHFDYFKSFTVGVNLTSQNSVHRPHLSLMRKESRSGMISRTDARVLTSGLCTYKCRSAHRNIGPEPIKTGYLI